MKAFIENFKDINLIHRWICIDDNSSAEDREEMKKDWPFFEFIWKSPEQKGHPKSMQILTSMITTPYLMLLDRRHYVKEMIDILESDAALGQVVFNKNYRETATENICGGIEKITPRKTLYYEHEHCRTNEEIANFNKRHNYLAALNCYYYPHFSLSPSMIKTDIFKTLKFEDELCFEYQFAQRYVACGFKTAFLPGYYFKHIGRLTNDRHSLTCNAYDLLTTPQFFDIPKYKSFVINLAKRTDRLNRLKRYSGFLPPNTAVMSACDGYMLIRTPRLYSLCEKCDYQMRPGVIGCALSHLVLYHKLLFDESVDGYLIFEDDVTPDKTFMSKLNRVLIVLKNRNAVADLIFFTTVLKNENHKFREEGVIKKQNRQDINVDSIGGTGCYYISKNAAMAVFDYIENHTLDVAIDALLFNISHLVETYFVQPCIISQTDVSGVSNIQHDHDIVSPLFLVNPTVDKKVVYNNDISTSANHAEDEVGGTTADKKFKIDLFDNIYMRQSDGLGVNMSLPMKSLSEMYTEFPMLLTESDV
jgi:GR25 family glycosyltransferase involved in LPS biosynthesis